MFSRGVMGGLQGVGLSGRCWHWKEEALKASPPRTGDGAGRHLQDSCIGGLLIHADLFGLGWRAISITCPLRRRARRLTRE